MHVTKVTPETIRYNAQDNAFEALVTLETLSGTYRYPCSFQGSIKMPLTTAAHKLSQQAKQRHDQRSGLFARTATAPEMAFCGISRRQPAVVPPHHLA